MDRNDLIGNIAGMEWRMFGLAENTGNCAESQDDYITFMIMRTAQFMAWNDEMLDSYYQDLNDAYDNDRNLMTEKYGYLMKWTQPDKYEEIKDRLPVVSQEKLDLLDQIMAIQTKQTEAFQRQYPNLGHRGRPITAAGSWPVTSPETYGRSEMQTYSLRTLGRYLDYLKLLEENSMSLVEHIMLYTVLAYGYKSLEDAEAAG